MARTISISSFIQIGFINTHLLNLKFLNEHHFEARWPWKINNKLGSVFGKDFMPGLKFQGGIRGQNLEILSKRISRTSNSRPKNFLVFWKLLLLLNESRYFWKIHKFLCNTGQVLGVCGYFLLLMGGDSFPEFTRNWM